MMNFLFAPQPRRSTVDHRALVAEGAQLLDVRTPAEFSAGHAPGAKNVPVDELAARLPELAYGSRQVVVYCRSGARSARAAQMLRAAGYEVVDIGSLDAW